MKKSVIFLLIISVCLIVAGCSAQQEEPQTTEAEISSTAVQESTTTGSGKSMPSEFEPFECSGDYYSFDKSCQPLSENGVQFYCAELNDGFINTIFYKIGDSEKVLYNSPVEISIDGYVDNALYFHTVSTEENTVTSLYRIEISYDETGDIYDSSLSYVSSYYDVLIKAEKNSLILSDSLAYNGSYARLDTLTGELTPIEYMKEATYADYSDKAPINEAKALEIAKSALSDNQYWNMSWQITENLPTFNGVVSSIFYVHPYYIVGKPGITLETYPDYAWEFTLDYKVYTVYISINAVTGDVCYVDIQLND